MNFEAEAVANLRDATIQIMTSANGALIGFIAMIIVMYFAREIKRLFPKTHTKKY